jgi:large subunit ribosomal protein L15
MMIHEITGDAGKYRTRKRVGRGEASGVGGTSGRGHKGARSRSGWHSKRGHEGGRITIIRRMPKRGFSNVQVATAYQVVNLKALEARMKDGAEVTPQVLLEAGLISDPDRPVKILGEGTLTRRLNITAAAFSASARQKIEQVGGSATAVVRTVWTRAAAEAAKGGA